MIRRRKPIARSSKPLRRGKPPARTKRPRRQRKTGPAALARACDKLWSLIVRRRGACESSGRLASEAVLQAAHGFSRRYRATRWNLLNGFCLSAAAHVYYTHRPLEWDQWLRDRWGEPVYNELRRIALAGKKPDLEETLARLKAEWGQP